jgi:hypothetical protein
MPINELPLPHGVVRTPDAEEILRVFLDANRNMDLSLKRGFPDVAIWGTLLADVARHAANAYGDFGLDPLNSLKRIHEAFNEDLAQQVEKAAKF